MFNIGDKYLPLHPAVVNNQSRTLETIFREKINKHWASCVARSVGTGKESRNTRQQVGRRYDGETAD
jgi:hypothetical protein